MQYQGQILDGQMHGTGKLTYENLEYYDGEWVRGKDSRNKCKQLQFDI